MPNVMIEFLNKFVIKGTNIYFGHEDKVYVISKQLIINVFGVCAKEYVEEPKRHVNKSLTIHSLYSCRLALTNSSIDQWNAKSLGLPYSIRYPLYRLFIKGRRSNILTSRMMNSQVTQTTKL
jgi:hypothetical protein